MEEEFRTYDFLKILKVCEKISMIIPQVTDLTEWCHKPIEIYNILPHLSSRKARALHAFVENFLRTIIFSLPFMFDEILKKKKKNSWIDPQLSSSYSKSI